MSNKEEKISLSHYYPFTLRHLYEEDSKITCIDPKGDSINPNSLFIGSAGKGRAFSLKEVAERLSAKGIKTFFLSEKSKKEFLEIVKPLSGDIVDFLPKGSVRETVD